LKNSRLRALAGAIARALMSTVEDDGRLIDA
jgi:hypothetical protein